MFYIQFTLFTLLLNLINTQFDLQDYGQIITNEHRAKYYWGTYKPNLYFAMKNRKNTSDVFGIMWYGAEESHYTKQGDIAKRTRHNCKMEDNLNYHWEVHNGLDYGEQVIKDDANNLVLNTKFIKTEYDSLSNQQWFAMVNGTRINDNDSSAISMVLYMNLENYDISQKAHLKFNEDDLSLTGYEDGIEKFVVRIKVNSGDVVAKGFQKYRKVYNATWQVKKFVTDDLVKTEIEYVNKTWEYATLKSNNIGQPNIVALQFVFKTQFSISVAFDTKKRDTDILVLEQLVKLFDAKNSEFNKKFKHVFNLDDKFTEEHISMGKQALSNLLGGIGYFYGAIKINLGELTSGSYHKGFRYAVEPKGLFTATPSRSFFARGFLWDEGFHNILINQWDINLTVDIFDSWLSTMSATGWIAREQMRGMEAEAQVPEKFIIQDKMIANPPTLIFAIESIMKHYKFHSAEKGMKHVHNFLKKCFDKLGAWYEWFEVYQKSPDRNSYQWYGRNSEHNLASGLDDFPRGMTPNIYERHLDLHLWVMQLLKTLRNLSEIFDKELISHFDKKIEESQINMEKLYFNSELGVYSDFIGPQFKYIKTHKFSRKVPPYLWRGDGRCGNEALNPLDMPAECNPYSDAPCCSEFGWCGNTANHCNCQKCRRALKLENRKEFEMLETYNPHLGYVNLYPLAFGVLKTNEPAFDKLLTYILDPEELGSNFGLRSLTKADSLYHSGEDYWRGNVWINLNYLTLRGLKKYYSDNEKAMYAYSYLRSSLIKTIFTNWKNTGLFYEQYSDIDGKGLRVRPFNGWTSLILNILAEKYE
jgi:mannosyl-oligosaccharide glucosidase